MISQILPVLLVLGLAALSQQCDIQSTLNSETYIPHWAQFTFHNGTKSPIYEMGIDNMDVKIHITGQWCGLKPTKLTVWKDHAPKEGDKPLGETFAFIDGMGMNTYSIYANSGPRMAARAGILCSFGDCGARG